MESKTNLQPRKGLTPLVLIMSIHICFYFTSRLLTLIKLRHTVLKEKVIVTNCFKLIQNLSVYSKTRLIVPEVYVVSSVIKHFLLNGNSLFQLGVK